MKGALWRLLRWNSGADIWCVRRVVKQSCCGLTTNRMKLPEIERTLFEAALHKFTINPSPQVQLALLPRAPPPPSSSHPTITAVDCSPQIPNWTVLLDVRLEIVDCCQCCLRFFVLLRWLWHKGMSFCCCYIFANVWHIDYSDTLSDVPTTNMTATAMTPPCVVQWMESC